MIKAYRELTEQEFGDFLTGEEQTRLLASVFQLHIWGKKKICKTSKLRRVLRAFDPTLTNEQHETLQTEAEQIQDLWSRFSMKLSENWEWFIVLKCGAFLAETGRTVGHATLSGTEQFVREMDD